jgi:hypothetical protein
VKNTINGRIDSPNFFKELIKFTKNKGVKGKMLGQYLHLSTVRAIEEGIFAMVETESSNPEINKPKVD